MPGEKEYLKNIFSFLENIDNANTISPNYNEEFKEKELNLLSKNLFEDLYNNLLYYYNSNGKNNIATDKQKNFYNALFDILSIIYESDSDCFLKNTKIQLALIFLINFFKESVIVNIEIVCKIFFSLSDKFKNIKNGKINKEVSQFEEKVFETVKFCLNKFISDFEIELDNNNFNNYANIIECLDSLENVSIPLHLKGFMKYNKENAPIKLLITKIYEYIKEINPFKDYKSSNINYHLYQGYSLYEIISHNKKDDEIIDIKAFNKIKTNRIKDINAKSILELSIKLLKAKSNEEFQNILSKQIINLETESPKISDNFDKTGEYYKDLYEQLNYYLKEYKENTTKKFCKIILNNFYRVLWLNFNKVLLLNLSQKGIESSHIKVIFYFIVNLFNPDIDINSSLEFREDTIPMLYSQCLIQELLLDNEDILRLIDIDYSQYYTKSQEKIKFNQIFINLINDKILKNKNVVNYLDDNAQINEEVGHILKCCGNLPFPLLHDYLIKEKKIAVVDNTELSLFNFYRNCFCDLGNYEAKNFIEHIRNINIHEPNEEEKERLIKEIIENKSFLELLNQIMTSTVMNNAYYIINKFYLLNGKINIDEEMKIIESKKNIDLDQVELETLNLTNKSIEINSDQEKSSLGINSEINKAMNNDDNSKINEKTNNNFINKNPVITYYNKYCKELKNFDYSNTLIVMNLPNTIKGFTFRFLKIVLNSRGIKLNVDNTANTSILLRAYLIFVIIHEQNHFIKRYFNKGVNAKLCNTPKINGYDEGGRHLIKILFGEEMINKNLNLEQANFILEPNNWKKSIFEFKNEFMKIESGGNKESILYLDSEYSSICDHSKLHA